HMIGWLRSRLHKNEEGFTLIELMVVVLIIAILIAIAIPTFLGARERAQDRAAQSDLRNALAAEKVYYVDEEAYTATPADLTAIEPSLAFDGTDVAVALDAADDQVVCITGVSASGTTFVIADIATGTGSGTHYSDTALATCDRATVSALSTDGW
ncbi:MAG: type IV pilin protein, partial [Acidimicrobiia bacterium]